MAETPRKGKQSAQELRNLAHGRKWAKGSSKDGPDTQTELNTVKETDSKDGLGRQAIRPQEKDKVGQGQVQVDVLEAEQRGEHESTIQESALVTR